ncbi:importin subunit alpha-4-like [Apostichopus japonicus]|uniref:importin subunit alpha-4-like n=1 Tax=Stichopus japonicus TaxID=307972 RepID=UPI003AB852F6
MPGVEENRFRAFKNKGKDMSEMRRRRQDNSVELRKAKKEENIMKRRNVAEDEETVSPLQEKKQPTVTMTIPEIWQAVNSNNPEQQRKAVHCARKLLSRERDPPIQTVIDNGFLPKFVEFLSHNDDPDIQFEAAWALTNVASGTRKQTMDVVDQNAIPAFVNLLSSTHPRVCEQAVWALGNIAGDGPKLRDQVIRHGVLNPLLALIQPATPTPFLRNVTWTLSNLCRNKNPPPPLEVVTAALPQLKKLINCCDKEVVADALWALSYLTDGSNERIAMVCEEPGIITRLVHMVQSSTLIVLTPALRTIGNIVTGTDEQTQLIVDSGVLAYFGGLLEHNKANVKKEACWALSNITAGPPPQIQSVIDAKLLPALVDVLANGDFKSQKEACWALSNLTTSGTLEQIILTVQNGCLPAICGILKAEDPKILVVAMEALANILAAAKRLNQLEAAEEMIEEYHGVSRIEDLQQHKNEDVYKKAYQIIDEYFSEEAAEEDEEEVPGTTSEGNYEMNIVDTVEGTLQFTS